MMNPKIRHQALADQFGTNRSTVSRTLQDWAYWQSIDEAGLPLARRMCVPVPLAHVVGTAETLTPPFPLLLSRNRHADPSARYRMLGEIGRAHV